MSPLPDDTISRRAFGQLLGAAAVAGQLPATPAMAMTDATPKAPAAGDEICDLSAVDLAARIRRKLGM